MAKQLTTKQVMAGFGVSDMTVYSWRQGTPTKAELPCTKNGTTVTFDEAKMIAWGKKHSLAWNAAAAAAVPDSKRVGPKVAVKQAPAKKSALGAALAARKAKAAEAVPSAKRVKKSSAVEAVA